MANRRHCGRLIQRIHRGVATASSARYAILARKRDRRTLTAAEHAELLQLTHEMESRDADRAQALLELAQLRRVSVRALMAELGIKVPSPVG